MWIDLSQPIQEKMPHERRFPIPRIKVHRQEVRFVDGKDVLSSSELLITAHSGTHVEAPSHFYRDGRTLDEFPLEAFHGEGVALDVVKGALSAILAEELETGASVRADDIVLLHTGWGARYGQKDYDQHPYLHMSAARWLVERKVKMVGIDAPSVDLPAPLQASMFNWPIHRLLLGKDILIIENLGNLEQVSAKRLVVSAFPMLIRGSESAPVRVAARLDIRDSANRPAAF